MRLGFRVTHVLTQRSSPKVSAEFNRLAALELVHAATDSSRHLHQPGSTQRHSEPACRGQAQRGIFLRSMTKTPSRTISVLLPRSPCRVRLALWPNPTRLLQTPQ